MSGYSHNFKIERQEDCYEFQANLSYVVIGGDLLGMVLSESYAHSFFFNA